MSSEIEYLPLEANGFIPIKLWQLDQYFLDSFHIKQPRTELINRLKAYLTQFAPLGLNVEVWIDGSFCTFKPDPADVDLALLLDPEEVDNLTAEKQAALSHLTLERVKLRARYLVDVYIVNKKDPEDLEKWEKFYGTDRSNLNKKGIYTIQIPPFHV